MDDDPTKRSLADDPDFLSSLDYLDRGLSRTDLPAAPKGPTPEATSGQPGVDRFRQATPAGAGSPKPLRTPSVLDLFPSRETHDGRTPASVPAGGASAVQPALPTNFPSVALRRQERRSAPRGPAPPYVTFYGFDEQPFAPAADPRFFFQSRSHDRAAQELLTAIRRHDAVVALVGAAGTGKTTLCRAVLEQLDRRTLTSYIAEPIASFEELLRTLLADLGVITDDDVKRGTLASAGRVELLTTLRDFLVSLAPLDAFAVLFIDGAERVSTDMLQQIGVLTDAEADKRFLQVVFVGETRFERKLQQPELASLANRVNVVSRLEPLQRDEVGAYIAHRLSVAGKHPRLELTAGAIQRLFAFSGGLPAVVNVVADRAMERAHESAASTIDAKLVNGAAMEFGLEASVSRGRQVIHVAASVGLLLALMCAGAALAAYVYQDRIAEMLHAWAGAPAPPPAPLLRTAAPFSPAPAPPDISP